MHDPVERIDHAESFFTALGAKVAHGGDRAYYNVTHDRIRMPLFAHHSSRVDRVSGSQKWGDEGSLAVAFTLSWRPAALSVLMNSRRAVGRVLAARSVLLPIGSRAL